MIEGTKVDVNYMVTIDKYLSVSYQNFSIQDGEYAEKY